MFRRSPFVNNDAAIQREDVAKFPHSRSGLDKNVLNEAFVAWHYFIAGYVMAAKEQILTARPIRDIRSRDMHLVERMARWMDSRFTIPGTNIRFGIDPLLSLFPVFGDLLTYIISGALIYNMHNQGASRNVVVKMILNSTLDAIIGAIPLIGTVFDIFYRANDRNVRLLREHYFEGKHQGSGSGLLFMIAVIAVLVAVAAIYGMYKLFGLLFNLFPDTAGTDITICGS